MLLLLYAVQVRRTPIPPTQTHTHTHAPLCPLFILFFYFADPSGAVAHISLSPLLPHPFITKGSQMLTSTHGERDRREGKEGVKRASV